MRVLVACEFSGIVRDAFTEQGNDAWSCDILPSESQGNHLQADISDILADQSSLFGYWDMLIAFPPCTHLCVSGAKWFKYKREEQELALRFVSQLASAPIARICIENPVGILSTRWRKPDQIIQPWMFGHRETKSTCLWLKNLPRLRSTEIVPGMRSRVHTEPPGPNRWKNRSRTMSGIAAAMANQWSNLYEIEQE